MTPHCATCTCSAIWEVLTHHLIMIVERALGFGLGIWLGLGLVGLLRWV